MKRTELVKQLPIVLREGHDCTLYESTAAAERDLEPWYARDPVAELYDVAGRRLRMLPHGAHVRIESVEVELSHAEELRRRLAEVPVAIGRVTSESSNLRDLIEECRKAGLARRG